VGILQPTPNSGNSNTLNVISSQRLLAVLFLE